MFLTCIVLVNGRFHVCKLSCRWLCHKTFLPILVHICIRKASDNIHEDILVDKRSESSRLLTILPHIHKHQVWYSYLVHIHKVDYRQLLRTYDSPLSNQEGTIHSHFCHRYNDRSPILKPECLLEASCCKISFLQLFFPIDSTP